MLDSADTDDAAAPPAKVAAFHSQLEALKPLDQSGTGWILTHRPFWGFVPAGAGELGESDELPSNRTEQEAAKDDPLAGVQMILSGHVHIFSASDFAGARPSQLIVGVGGDTRDGAQPDLQARKVTIAGLPAATEVVEQFGYVVLDRVGEGWNAALKRPDGVARSAAGRWPARRRKVGFSARVEMQSVQTEMRAEGGRQAAGGIFP